MLERACEGWCKGLPVNDEISPEIPSVTGSLQEEWWNGKEKSLRRMVKRSLRHRQNLLINSFSNRLLAGRMVEWKGREPRKFGKKISPSSTKSSFGSKADFPKAFRTTFLKYMSIDCSKHPPQFAQLPSIALTSQIRWESYRNSRHRSIK
jgi:hypothetical protein